MVSLVAACGGEQSSHTRNPPVATEQRSKAGNVIYTVDPLELEALRLHGDKAIAPDDKSGLSGKKLVGSFKLCLDETGQYESGVVLRSTGIANYDAKIVREMMTWAYQPFLIAGVAAPVCSAVTFIYTQH